MASKNVNKFFVFPTINDIPENKEIAKIIYFENNCNVVGANMHKTLKIIKNIIWKINIPLDSFNCKINSFSSDYYVDKNKIIMDSINYKPYNLNNIVVISFMSFEKLKNNTYLTVIFIDLPTGKIIKSYLKHNVLKTVPLVINLVRNFCSVIYTNSLTNSSTILTFSFYYNFNKSKEFNIYLDKLLIFKESYSLATFKVSFAAFSKTRFGFSYTSLIIVRHDGRIQAINFVFYYLFFIYLEYS